MKLNLIKNSSKIKYVLKLPYVIIKFFYTRKPCKDWCGLIIENFTSYILFVYHDIIIIMHIRYNLHMYQLKLQIYQNKLKFNIIYFN